jgi:molecular chaperone GrpE
MSERPNGSTNAQTTADPARSEAKNEDRDNPLAMASEAAAEHVMHDADAQGREDIAELQGLLDASRAEAAELHDRWLRLNAEFDNFRKRTAKERLEADPVRWGERA